MSHPAKSSGDKLSNAQKNMFAAVVTNMTRQEAIAQAIGIWAKAIKNIDPGKQDEIDAASDALYGIEVLADTIAALHGDIAGYLNEAFPDLRWSYATPGFAPLLDA